MTAVVVRRRSLGQQLVQPRFAKPADLVRWMGAVQAQHYLGSLWAIGMRLRDAMEADIEAAIAKRQIVRTWPMRGTLHFVAASDVHWMLPLLTPRVLARALEGGRALTCAEAYAVIDRHDRRRRPSRDSICAHRVPRRLLRDGRLAPRRGRSCTNSKSSCGDEETRAHGRVGRNGDLVVAVESAGFTAMFLPKRRLRRRFRVRSEIHFRELT